jgi:hypothetical protein
MLFFYRNDNSTFVIPEKDQARSWGNAAASFEDTILSQVLGENVLLTFLYVYSFIVPLMSTW